MIRTRRYELSLDYGQFYLHLGGTGDDDVMALLDRASGDGIAQGENMLLVLSPHQNNFDMPVTVEEWEREPPDDLDDWQEAFAASVTIGAGGLLYETPTHAQVPIDVPPGRYDLRIAGRGFVTHGWPGSTEPGDVWRLQPWPGGEPAAPRRLRAWTMPAATD